MSSQSTDHAALLAAALVGNLGTLNAALPGAAAAGVLDEPGPDGTYTPLALAARGGHAECVQALCAAGCDPNASPPLMGGVTALHMAAGSPGSEGAIRALAAAGAALDKQDCDGTTPLMFAACEGRAAAVRALLQLGAKPGAADGAGRTPLMIAAQAGHDECVAALLEAGAAASPRCKAGPTALEWAAAHGHARCVELLAPATPATARWRAVELAARTHSAACLQALAAGGVLTAAEAARALPLVLSKTRLVALGVSAQDASKLAGQEAVLVPGSRPACIAALVAAGADASAALPGRDDPPLFWACAQGDAECVRALLAHGARSAVARKEGGVTPLMLAASLPRGEVVKALLEAADARDALEMQGASGKTALALAVWSFRKHGDAQGGAAAVQALLDAGADVEAADNDGARPLHWAADSGFTAAARLLLAAGAKPAAATPGGITPLLLAQHFKRAEVAQVLEQALLRAHAQAVADAAAAGRPPPALPAGLQGPLTSYTVDLVSGRGEWLVQQAAGTDGAPAPPSGASAAKKQSACCCIQ